MGGMAPSPQRLSYIKSPWLPATLHGVSGAIAEAETTWRDVPTCVDACIMCVPLKDSGGHSGALTTF